MKRKLFALIFILCLTVSNSVQPGNVSYAKTEESLAEWNFAAFGQGVSGKEENSGFKLNDDGSVTVWSLNGKGKIVPASTDGLSFYYIPIPANKNFTLTATVKVDSWTFTNGQEGFGLMAADRVGEHGDKSSFWNNSYMVMGTKVEYYFDPLKGEVVNDGNFEKITMKNGLGAQEKKGVTKENLSLFESNDTATVNQFFSSTMYTLENSCARKGSGVYNLWENEKTGAQNTIDDSKSEVRLRIQKNNTGYFLSYLDNKDNVFCTQKFYDPEALEQLDEENVYVGFFAARTVTATFSDIDISVTDPKNDAPAEERPITYVNPDYKVVSAPYANSDLYLLEYVGNADGYLTVTNSYGEKLLDEQEVIAGETVGIETMLKEGINSFKVSVTPLEDYLPDNDEYKRLSSYETKEFNYAVKYETINNDDSIYVSPDGTPEGDGSIGNEVDIYTAVKYVKLGRTIVLQAGEYSLDETVTVYRGINGTEDAPINMMSEGGRAIFNFNSACAGFVFAGDYWHVKGIDCTHSGNGQKGIQVSGNSNILEDVYAYENGNTGIQLSRFLNSDNYENWPCDNLITNCISYGNADSGFEDADGFAAKLTVGDRNIFNECIAYNNADDGWDLFAKVETGIIGKVTIQNCVAFSNGYGLDGSEQGNGNGFKMGGSNMPGQHMLINSVAWGNKAKGIDSNSGPDIQIYDCKSFNNGANNVALYTNSTQDTAYYVDGLISYRTENKDVDEKITPGGTQNNEDIYRNNNFFWIREQSRNADDVIIEDDWFESLEAPVADVNDPLAVAMNMRTSEGSIDLGSFLKLSAKGTSELENASKAVEESSEEISLDSEEVIPEKEEEIKAETEENVDNTTEEKSPLVPITIAAMLILAAAIVIIKGSNT
ncbi:hypothetical protein [Butyrivibrio sp.]|uniref:hypothetical protein n=1 Tax=Butyrivibrio sp. TaxID=28121 RepID=UPI0025C69968|nr:hypothetical protein [Butyrivibrio sp.]MBE5837710.1 hypothetical protein [Butyrivibrio sp.]